MKRERERKLGTGFLDCPVAGGRLIRLLGVPEPPCKPRPQLLWQKLSPRGAAPPAAGSSLGQIDTELPAAACGPWDTT